MPIVRTMFVHRKMKYVSEGNYRVRKPNEMLEEFAERVSRLINKYLNCEEVSNIISVQYVESESICIVTFRCSDYSKMHPIIISATID